MITSSVCNLIQRSAAACAKVQKRGKAITHIGTEQKPDGQYAPTVFIQNNSASGGGINLTAFHPWVGERYKTYAEAFARAKNIAEVWGTTNIVLRTDGGAVAVSH